MLARVFTTIVRFDKRSISRDRFLWLVITSITLILGILALVGYFRDALGVAAAAPWIPYVLILVLISNPASYGMVFGLLLIEEVETSVRAALMTTPVSPALFVLMRTPLLVLILFLVGFATGFGLSAAWGIAELSASQWLLLALTAAAIGPAIMISMSTFATNRIEALAIGKIFSATVTPPILLYLLDPDAWYTFLFLVFPTTPVVYAYEAFRGGIHQTAYAWLMWGGIYAAILTALAVRRYLQRSFGDV